jgi:hypothetical protein
MGSNDGHFRAWGGGDYDTCGGGDYDVEDDSDDQQLQIALRISAELAHQREAATTGEARGATPAGSGSVTTCATVDGSDNMLREALAIYMAQPQANTQSTSPASFNVPARATKEDDEVSRYFQREFGEAQTENKEDADYFEIIKGTEKKRNGQNEATYLCCCCPLSRFGYDIENGTWSLDLDTKLRWKNPITFRVTPMDFKRGCRDHVRSKNERHRCWETVDKVHKMMTSGNGIASLSQEDLKNLATTGEILEKYKIYKGVLEDTGNTISVEEQEGVKKKFEQARLVLEKFKLEINEQLKIRTMNKKAEQKSAREKRSAEGKSGGGVSTWSLVQETLQSLPPEKRRRLDEKLRELLLNAIQEEKKETEGTAKGGSSSRGTRGSTRGGKSCVEEGNAGGQQEENLLQACKEDLYAWPIAAQHLAEVAQLSMPYCLL